MGVPGIRLGRKWSRYTRVVKNDTRSRGGKRGRASERTLPPTVAVAFM